MHTFFRGCFVYVRNTINGREQKKMLRITKRNKKINIFFSCCIFKSNYAENLLGFDSEQKKRRIVQTNKCEQKWKAQCWLAFDNKYRFRIMQKKKSQNPFSTSLFFHSVKFLSFGLKSERNPEPTEKKIYNGKQF